MLIRLYLEKVRQSYAKKGMQKRSESALEFPLELEPASFGVGWSYTRGSVPNEKITLLESALIDFMFARRFLRF